MRPAHLNSFIITDNFTRVGPGIRDLVHARTEELAVMAGRAPHDVSLEDYAQAKRELTGQSDRVLQDTMLGMPGSIFAARHGSKVGVEPDSGVAA